MATVHNDSASFLWNVSQNRSMKEMSSMIIDLTLTNFRSFQTESVFSMNVEGARDRHSSNFTPIEDGRLRVLRSAAIFGANASGKSNLLTALIALKWLVQNSGTRKEGQNLPPYEPFRLSDDNRKQPVRIELEFVVPTGIRYKYEVEFTRNKITKENLYSFAKRAKALIFERSSEDTWETIRFGGNYRGGNRRFPFFQNSSYLSRAGNDASAPEFMREIYKYFGNITHMTAGDHPFFSGVTDPVTLAAVSELICLADTGVTKVTMEENDKLGDLKLPESMPEEIKEFVIEQNKFITKYWMKSHSGELISFDEDEMSEGTSMLFKVLPVVLDVLRNGTVLLFDEIDAHFHTDIVHIIIRLFHDQEINKKGAQLIFTTHDTNILDSGMLRRDQIWFTTKIGGASSIKSLDEYDRKYVRHDSPFEALYRAGRLGALPMVSFGKMKEAILSALVEKEPDHKGDVDA